jgi:hypothetical protein
MRHCVLRNIVRRAQWEKDTYRNRSRPSPIEFLHWLGAELRPDPAAPRVTEDISDAHLFLVDHSNDIAPAPNSTLAALRSPEAVAPGVRR